MAVVVVAVLAFVHLWQQGAGESMLKAGSFLKTSFVLPRLQAFALVLHELVFLLPDSIKNNVRSSPFIGDTSGFASATPPSKMSLQVHGMTLIPACNMCSMHYTVHLRSSC